MEMLLTWMVSIFPAVMLPLNVALCERGVDGPAVNEAPQVTMQPARMMTTVPLFGAVAEIRLLRGCKVVGSGVVLALMAVAILAATVTAVSPALTVYAKGTELLVVVRMSFAVGAPPTVAMGAPGSSRWSVGPPNICW